MRDIGENTVLMNLRMILLQLMMDFSKVTMMYSRKAKGGVKDMWEDNFDDDTVNNNQPSETQSTMLKDGTNTTLGGGDDADHIRISEVCLVAEILCMSVCERGW